MKYLFCVLAGLFILQMGFSQELTGVVNINDKPAEKLFNSTREWFALNFQTSKDEVKLADNSTHVFIAKGEKRETVLIKNIKMKVKMGFTLKLDFKDGRFKYEFSNMEYRNALTNQVVDIETYKQCSTVEGLEAYYKSNGIPKFLEGKKEDEAKRNEENYRIVTAMPSNIIKDLTVFLQTGKNENW
ncbi:MAG: DUF4468 domain-containing protein [Bacteroidota bacterium]|nr:DUF4468 domain-containing protein [Bacteroidota bacterium]